MEFVKSKLKDIKNFVLNNPPKKDVDTANDSNLDDDICISERTPGKSVKPESVPNVESTIKEDDRLTPIQMNSQEGDVEKMGLSDMMPNQVHGTQKVSIHEYKSSTHFGRSDTNIPFEYAPDSYIVNSLRNEHAPNSKSIVQLEKFPEISNKEVAYQQKRLGQYNYSKEYVEFKGKPYIGPLVLEGQGVYYGQFKYGFRHGKGKQLFLNGSLYEGTWRNDMAHGCGRLIHNNGDAYEGEWVEDRAHGFGRYTHFDGNYYEGPWINDELTGLGCEVFYIEEVTPENFGTEIKNNRYEGNYINGKKHGNGRFFWANGSCYKGQFSFDYLHGEGEYIWYDGRKYKGDWKNNEMHGHGTFSWPNNNFYEGSYRHDKKQGFGAFVKNEWVKEEGEEVLRVLRYEGKWDDGKQGGQANFIVTVNGKETFRKRGEWWAGQWKRWIKN